jgi:signal peptidase II
MKRASLIQGGIIALFSLTFDQLSKNWVILEHGLHSQHIAEVTSFFNLVLVWNRGVSFGMFSSHPHWMPWILTGVALILTAILIGWLAKTERKAEIIGLGLVVGGAIGNVIDRIRFGAVIDFLDFHLTSMHWPAFNLADSFIFIGVVLLVFETILVSKQPSNEASAAE